MASQISLLSSTVYPLPCSLERQISTDYHLPQVFSTIGECEGISDNAHRVFLVTNEYGQSSTLDKLKRHPTNGDTMIGVSGFFTLNAASIRATTSEKPSKGIKYLVLVDRSKRVNDFWISMQNIIADSSDRIKALNEIKSLLMMKRDIYYTRSSPSQSSSFSSASYYIHQLEEEVRSGKSWLSTNEQYGKIKRIFDAGHFTFKRLNLCNKDAMDEIATIMEENQMSLDSLYLSNTREYAEDDGLLEVYQKSLDRLATKKAFVIDTKPRGCFSCVPLTQRVFRRNRSNLSVCFPTRPPSECQSPPSTTTTSPVLGEGLAKLFKKAKPSDFFKAIAR